MRRETPFLVKLKYLTNTLQDDWIVLITEFGVTGLLSVFWLVGTKNAAIVFILVPLTMLQFLASVRRHDPGHPANHRGGATFLGVGAIGIFAVWGALTALEIPILESTSHLQPRMVASGISAIVFQVLVCAFLIDPTLEDQPTVGPRRRLLPLDEGLVVIAIMFSGSATALLLFL